LLSGPTSTNNAAHHLDQQQQQQQQHHQASSIRIVRDKFIKSSIKICDSGVAGVAMHNGRIFAAAGTAGYVAVHDASTGRLLQQIGSKGDGDGQFQCAWGLCFDEAADRLFVTDFDRRCIQVFDATHGRFMQKVELGFEPCGLCLHAGLLYVADATKHRTVVLRASDFAFIRAFGSEGQADGLLDSPGGVVIVDSTLYVTEANNHRVSAFTLGGQFVRKWGSRGSGDGQLNYPLGLHSDGRFIYVADCHNHRVQIFTLHGEFVAKFGKRGERDGELKYPWSVFISNDVLMVGDYTGRVHLFE
jgi:DNA-binding beta-propeller fold protein YncE